MKNLATLILVGCCFISVQAQNIAGKWYKAEITASCKEMVNGGCMIYTYRILRFTPDSVFISYAIEANCSPKEREAMYEEQSANHPIQKYTWQFVEGFVDIKGFDDYGKLQFVEGVMIGTYREEKEVVFVEVP